MSETNHMHALNEWRERIGVRLMLATTCTHEGGAFGAGAVCETCFANVQRFGEIVQSQAAHAWEQGRRAERRDWEFLGDITTPDEDRQPWVNPYRTAPTDTAHPTHSIPVVGGATPERKQ